jgi:putative membrane protein
MMTIRNALFAGLAAASLFACGNKDESPAAPASPPPAAKPAAPAPAPAAPTPAPAPKAAGPTDAQIAHIAVTANQIDIDAAKIAAAKTKNPDVKTFAELMIKDHGSANQAAGDLAKKLNLTPADNDTSKALLAGAEQNKADLDKRNDADFDKAYVAHEVVYHEQVLAAIDKVLIPSAQNADLKNLLVAIRPVVAEHLDHARQLQTTLGK